MNLVELITLAGIMVTQFSLLWWKLGKYEQKLNNHIAQHIRNYLLQTGYREE